ncbi:predicted protein [Chaetoceros tenuissimus]|uniref:Uncharacterized protein n=1 Tax=Chaetoceros tenuissimus TaxID=426638 RepID=A0AAD3H4N2_9STRA|nr:predicted protein [Chaetoceros tenuissimus]
MQLRDCEKLIILNIPQHTVLGENVIGYTALFDASPFKKSVGNDNAEGDVDKVNGWVKSINAGRALALHRICCSTYENEALPISEAIYQEIKELGLQVLHIENKIGITPQKYLAENPYLENIDEREMLKRYIVEKMGQM